MTDDPGPWDYVQVTNPYMPGHVSYRIRAQSNMGKIIIAEIFTSSRPTAVNEENARLIAASPDLLSTLKRLTEKVARANAIQHSGGKVRAEDWAELYMITGEAQAVIKKAEGGMGHE